MYWKQIAFDDVVMVIRPALYLTEKVESVRIDRGILRQMARSPALTNTNVVLVFDFEEQEKNLKLIQDIQASLGLDLYTSFFGKRSDGTVRRMMAFHSLQEMEVYLFDDVILDNKLMSTYYRSSQLLPE